MTQRLRYVVTTADPAADGADEWRGLGLLGSGSRDRAMRCAHLQRLAGGRALVHDLDTGLVLHDTGRPLRHEAPVVSRTGQPSPEEMPLVRITESETTRDGNVSPRHSLSFEVGIDIHCPICGDFVPASTQHTCSKPREEDEIERTRRLSK